MTTKCFWVPVRSRSHYDAQKQPPANELSQCCVTRKHWSSCPFWVWYSKFSCPQKEGQGIHDISRGHAPSTHSQTFVQGPMSCLSAVHSAVRGGERVSAFGPMPFFLVKMAAGGGVVYSFLRLHFSWDHVTEDMWNPRKRKKGFSAVSTRENDVGMKSGVPLSPSRHSKPHEVKEQTLICCLLELLF